NNGQALEWLAVEHRYGNHSGKTARDAAVIEEVEAHLFAGFFVEVGSLVPGIGRGADRARLSGSVLDQVPDKLERNESLASLAAIWRKPSWPAAVKISPAR